MEQSYTCICQTCGATFETRRRAKFCSRVCYFATQKNHRRKPGVLRTCANPGCTNTFWVSPSRTSHRYCSTTCQNRTKRQRHEVRMICLTCSKTFTIYRDGSRKPEPLYCSRECWRNRNANVVMVELVCKGCGKPFRVPHWDYRQLYCSWACRRNPDAGRRPDYGPDWDGQRRAARRRDGHACQACRKVPDHHSLHVHHIVPFDAFGISRHTEANLLSNLVCLCGSCHRKVHYGRIPCPTPVGTQANSLAEFTKSTQ